MDSNEEGQRFKITKANEQSTLLSTNNVISKFDIVRLKKNNLNLNNSTMNNIDNMQSTDNNDKTNRKTNAFIDEDDEDVDDYKDKTSNFDSLFKC